MKIAIQGHPTRGKEVIQILESLGGRNAFNYNGDFIRTAYFIGMDYSIYGFCADSPKVGFKVYNLEAFETQFPFKIGDKVTIVGSPDFPKVITKMVWDCGEILYSFEGLNNIWFGAKALKKFEMKEERNIKLTLEKAKEWYNKGGELKEIALQAFTEKELNPLPRSWEEFCRKHKSVCLSTRYANMPLKYDALIKLEQLRDCWRQGWKPEWNSCEKFVIKWEEDNLIIFTARRIHAFLVFPTYEIAKEFLECFRDLIEKAGDLI